jgi:hypothetical protein
VSAFILCLCCPVYVAALRRADHSSKESYQLSIKCKITEPHKEEAKARHEAAAPYKKKK